MFSLAALVLLLSLHSTDSFLYLKNVTWQEANETCDLATPPITDWKNVALELPNIPDEYRHDALWTGYYRPDIVIENIGCLSAVNYTPTIGITVTPLIGDIGYCFSVCKAAATIGIQRKGSTLYCYCLTNDESLHEDSVNHCTLIQDNFQKANYGGREDQIALYRKAENRLVSENEDRNARCVAYDIEEREYVYKHCIDEIGVLCQNNDDDTEPMSGLSWKRGAEYCKDKSSVLPNEITPGLLDSLSDVSTVSHIWTRLQGKYTIIWKKPAITPVDLFVYLKQIEDDSNRTYAVHMIYEMRFNAICNYPLPENKQPENQNNTAAIVGGIVGASVLVLGGIVFFLIWVKYMRQRTSKASGTSSSNLAVERADNSTENNASGIHLDLDGHKDVYYNIERNVYDELQERSGDTHEYKAIDRQRQIETSGPKNKECVNLQLRCQTTS